MTGVMNDIQLHDRYYSMVPKAWEENLEFRAKMIRAATNNRRWQRELWCASSRSILFWANTFVWVYEPRHPEFEEIPFITWDFQDEVISRVVPALGKRDIGVEKSRDMGMSWTFLLVLAWRWLFGKHQSFMLVSRNEDLVDKTDDSDSLFWKVDWIISHLPRWMRPTMDRTNLHLNNLSRGNLIDGASTTGNVGRGGRRTAILMDELAAFRADDGYKALAATQNNTRCRIFLSTPQGASGAYYDVMHNRDSSMLKIRVHWSHHPQKSVGLYRCGSDGKVFRLKEGDTYEFPVGYSYVKDNKIRSPWYDNECSRSPIPAIIAQELDIDYMGSDCQFFDRDTLARIMENDVMEPYVRGRVVYDIDTGEFLGFMEDEQGEMKLWIYPIGQYELPEDRTYAMGIDVATGSRDAAGRGASHSVISVVDVRSCEKVGEYVTSGMDPMQFGKLAVAMAKWFRGSDPEGAFMIWESNGPGRLFGQAVIDSGYRNIYYKTREERLSKKMSDIPGFASTRVTKEQLLGEYKAGLEGRAVKQGRFINRSVDAIEECQMYIWNPGTREITHSGAVNTTDPTSARDNHGDRVIADALAYMAIRKRGGGGLPSLKKQSDDNLTEATFIGRRRRYDRERREREAW